MRSSGFTIVELLTVVVIIGLLVVVAVPHYQDYVRKAEFSNMWQAMEPVLKKATLKAISTKTCLTGTEKLVAGTKFEYRARSVVTKDGTICSVMAHISSSGSSAALMNHYILVSFNVRLVDMHEMKCQTDVHSQYYSPELCTYRSNLAALW